MDQGVEHVSANVFRVGSVSANAHGNVGCAITVEWNLDGEHDGSFGGLTVGTDRRFRRKLYSFQVPSEERLYSLTERDNQVGQSR